MVEQLWLADRENSKQAVWVRQAGKKEVPTGWQDKLYRPLDPAALIPGAVE